MFYLKLILSFIVVGIIAIISKTNNYFLAMVVPFFPTFTIVALLNNFERSPLEIKSMLIYGLISLPSLVVFYLAMYLLIDHLSLGVSVMVSLLFWSIALYFSLKLI